MGGDRRGPGRGKSALRLVRGLLPAPVRDGPGEGRRSGSAEKYGIQPRHSGADGHRPRPAQRGGLRSDAAPGRSGQDLRAGDQRPHLGAHRAGFRRICHSGNADRHAGHTGELCAISAGGAERKRRVGAGEGRKRCGSDGHGNAGPCKVYGAGRRLCGAGPRGGLFVRRAAAKRWLPKLWR